MPGYDLHTHSTFSDGTATPAENVALARERGLEGVAVTDHDTMDGWGEALAAASDSDLRIVPGVELSAEHDGASLHVLGYWVDPAHEGLRAELRRLHDTRFRRGELIVEKLQALGYDLSFDRVRRIAGDDLIARPHIAQAMVETGIVATEREAFDSYLSDDGPAYVPKHALAPVESLALIRDAGGACVLAHPGMWRGADSVPEALIEEMAAGGMGVRRRGLRSGVRGLPDGAGRFVPPSPRRPVHRCGRRRRSARAAGGPPLVLPAERPACRCPAEPGGAPRRRVPARRDRQPAE